MSKKPVKARVVNTDWENHPASYKQLVAINNAVINGETGRKRISLPLTKGEASEIIAKIKAA